MKYCSSNLSLIWIIAGLAAQYMCLFHKIEQTLGEREVLPNVTCSSRKIRAVFGRLVQSNLYVRDLTGEYPVRNVEHCGVQWKRDKNNNLIFISRYVSCFTLNDTKGSRWVIPLLVQLIGDDRRFEVNISCPWPRLHISTTFKRSAKAQSLYFATYPPPVTSLGTIATNPPPVTALGTIGTIKMRIAKDASFNSFFQEDQLPVAVHLGKAIYVEIKMDPPSLDLPVSLRVRDCFAYPASRRSVWTLLYDGCPYAVDNMRSSIPKDSHGMTTSHSQVRRFDVKTFAFVDNGHPIVEEIYFYCWVEICTEDVECAQHCTITSPEIERLRREASSGSKQAQFVSLGPLLMGENSTGPEDDPCVEQGIVFQSTMYALSAVSAALLLLLSFMVLSRMRKRPVTPCDTQLSIDPCQ